MSSRARCRCRSSSCDGGAVVESAGVSRTALNMRRTWVARRASRRFRRSSFRRLAAAFPSHWSLPKDKAPRLWYVEKDSMSAGSSGSLGALSFGTMSRLTAYAGPTRSKASGPAASGAAARAAQDSSNWPSPPLSSQKFLNVRPKNQLCAPFRSSAKPTERPASRRAVAASSRTSACVPLSSACCCFSFLADSAAAFSTA